MRTEREREQSRKSSRITRNKLGKEGVSNLNVRYALLRKKKVLTHYGNGILACVRCGFSDIRALSIDHIEGDGTQHRKNRTQGGTNFYAWLVRNNYPSGFQTLCMNCNWIKRVENKECTPGMNMLIKEAKTILEERNRKE